MALPMVKCEDPSENPEKLCSHCGLLLFAQERVLVLDGVSIRVLQRNRP